MSDKLQIAWLTPLFPTRWWKLHQKGFWYLILATLLNNSLEISWIGVMFDVPNGTLTRPPHTHRGRDTDCPLDKIRRAEITTAKWYSRWTFLERQIIELLQITSKIKFGLLGSLEHNSKMGGAETEKQTDLINQDFNPQPCPVTHLGLIVILRDDLLECRCNELDHHIEHGDFWTALRQTKLHADNCVLFVALLSVVPAANYYLIGNILIPLINLQLNFLPHPPVFSAIVLLISFGLFQKCFSAVVYWPYPLISC